MRWPLFGKARHRARASVRRRHHRTARIERLEDRQLLAADLVITELMARNNGGLIDADGDSPDWVEVYNPSDQAASMAGWSLTDDAGDLRKWSFPENLVVDPGDYLVVLASGETAVRDSILLTRDFHAARDKTFQVDLAEGTYDVRVVLGDAARIRDDITIYLQGKRVDAVDSAVGQYSVRTYQAEVNAETGGRLTLRLLDTGGKTGKAVINALEITPVGSGAAARFDFGTADSPVEPGYIGVLPEDVYSGSDGYGWLPEGTGVAARDSGPVAGQLHASFALNGDGDYVALVAPDGTVASEVGVGQADFPPQFPNISFGPIDPIGPVDPPQWAFFPTPTPGEANSIDDAVSGPLISAVTENPGPLDDGQDLVVTARIDPLNAPIDSVWLVYRVMFKNDASVPMTDDGSGPDAVAGDGIYSAVIPHTASVPGDMVRWYVGALDADGNGARGPMVSEPFTGAPFGFGRNFETGTADGLRPELGNWEVLDGRYRGTPADAGDVVSVIDAIGQLPENLWVTATVDIAAGGQSAVVFDYVDRTNFKFAAVDLDQLMLRIGQRDAAGWNTLAERELVISESLTQLELAVQIRGQSVTLKVDGQSLNNRFDGNVNGGQLGLGGREGTASFDEIVVRLPVPFARSESAEYFGTIVTDPTVDSNLPVLYWFVENTSRAATSAGTGASLYYLDEFYDNINVDIHGQSTSGSQFPKKSFDFDFNAGRKFKFSEDEGRVSDFNLLTNYADKTKVRNTLAYEAFRNAGHAAHLAFPIRVQQNGEFYSVQDWVEEGDTEFLERVGLDPAGALYKVNNGLDDAFKSVEKRSRKYEDRSDLEELVRISLLSDGALDLLSAEELDARGMLSSSERVAWYYDNLDLAGWANFLAAFIANDNQDCCHKNYYLYRDSEDSGLWQPLPWDLDLTFGHKWNGSIPASYFDERLISTAGLYIGNNTAVRNLFANPEFKAMYLRRVRTLLDELLQPPGTPPEELKYEARIDQIIAEIGADAALDQEKWGFHEVFTPQTPAEAAEDLKNIFLPARREFLYGLAELPPAQTANPEISFAVVVFDPEGGNQDQEYIELTNPGPAAADISGWQLRGAGIDFTFRGGTVIPAGDSLYVAADINAFRRRASGPRGGQSLFVQGDYAGRLTNAGGTLELVAADGAVVASTSYDGVASEAQKYLRITEVNYHPYDPLVAYGDANVDADRFEFIELLNTGIEPLDLAGVALTDGVKFQFGDVQLAGGARVLVVRDQAAFQSRYGTGLDVAGEFLSGKLKNSGETIRLEDAQQNVIVEFTYEDGGLWPGRADGKGAALEIVDPNADPTEPGNWRSTSEYGGSPGTAGTGPVVDVIVNEVLARSGGGEDLVELHNTTPDPVDLSAWYVSNGGDLLQVALAGGTAIAGGGYRVLTETELGFTLDGTNGDDVWLIAADAATGKPLRFADHVTFGGAATGVSLGRWPNGQASSALVAMAEQTFGVANSGPALVAGDMDGNGTVESEDVTGFVLGLRSAAGYEASFGVAPSVRGDTDGDGDFDFDDIAGFASLLPAAAAPEAVRALESSDPERPADFQLYVNWFRGHPFPAAEARLAGDTDGDGDVDFDDIGGLVGRRPDGAAL